MKERVYSLDILKIFATVFIVFHHYQIYTHTYFNNGINFNGGIFYFGYLVELFFILSGFFMVGYIDRIKNGLPFWEFFLPKYLRFLIPQMITCVVFAFLTIWYSHLYGEIFFERKVTVWGVIVASFGFSESWGIENPKMNGTIWYISVLFICYVIFYFCTWISKRLDVGSEKLYIVMIFLGMAIKTWCNTNFIFVSDSAARGYTAFFFGVLLAMMLKKNKPTFKLYILETLIVIGFPLLLYKYKGTYMSVGVNYILTYLFYPALIVLFISDIKKIFRFKFIGTVGKVSMDAFLWHFPVILGFINLNKYFGWEVRYDNYLYMMIVLIASYFLGALTYYYIEKPSTKYLVNKFVFDK